MKLYKARRLHPYSKLSFLLAITGLALALPRLLPLSSLLLLVALTFRAGGRKGFRDWLSGLTPLLYLIPFLFTLNSFFYGSGPPLWSLPLLPLGVTKGGLLKAGVISLRLAVVAGVSLWFARTTEAEELEVAFSKLGLPWKASFVFSLTLRLVPEFKRRFQKIKQSQVSRGLKITGPPWRRVRAHLPLMIPFMAAIVRYGYELGETLRARGFDSEGERSFFVELEIGRRDKFFLLYCGATLASFVLYFL